MRAERDGGGQSRLFSFARRACIALLAAACLMSTAETAPAQTIPNVSGSWTGSVTEQPAAGPFPGGISATNYVLYQNGSTVVGTGLSTLDGYWVNVVYAGSVSGSTLTLTSTVISTHLPFGYSPCPGTTTFAINSTSTELSAPASTCGGNVVDAFTMAGGGWNKQLGSSCDNPGGCSGGTDPIDLGSGNVNETFKDYETAGPNKLSFIHYYNSNSIASGMPAASYRLFEFDHWITNFDRALSFPTTTQVIAQRRDGQGVIFNLVGSTWTPDTDVDMVLTYIGSNTWTLTTHDDTVETYNEVIPIGLPGIGYLASIKSRNGYTQTVNRNGSEQITSVSDSYGRSLGFTYNSGGQLSTVTTPDSLVLTYTYSSGGGGTNNRLATVSYNTSPVTSKTFNYGNSSYPFALTSVTDENGNAYASWTYDSYGRGLTSQHAGGASVALAAVVHGLAMSVFDSFSGDARLQIRGEVTEYDEDCNGASELKTEYEKWADRLPGKESELWEWCLKQDQHTLLELLAFCAGCTVDVVTPKLDSASSRIAHINALSAALNLDMKQWFTPTAENFFKRVGRPTIVNAIREATGKPSKRSWEKLKKAEFAVLAERETAGTGWLPPVLRA